VPGKDIPEIKWGTFHDRDGIAHIAPVIEKRLMAPHILSERCHCGPTIEIRPKVTIIIHHVVH
jgi:hypothetical protein